MHPLTELRVQQFRLQIPAFAEGGITGCLRGIGEEFGELAERAYEMDQEGIFEEATDMAFGLLATENQSLDAWLRKKLDSAEQRIPGIIAKQEARHRGK